MNASSPSFACMRCGNCCRVSGYVRVTQTEIDAIAAYLDIPVRECGDRFTRLTSDRRGLSLTEKDDTTCAFLSPSGACSIHPVKPRQCKDFPIAWTFPGYERICRGAKGTGNGKKG